MTRRSMDAARAVGALLLLSAWAAPAAAQTDYYNLDRNRPVRIEDAYATERYAFELKLAALRLERASGGIYHWSVDPELAYGILPRTHVEIGFPFSIVDLGGAGQQSGLAGLELSALHNLNVETRTLPAFGVRADVLLPVGRLAPDAVHPSVTGIITRTFPWARFHVNAQYSFGPAPEVPVQPDERHAAAPGDHVSRWLAGIAVDRVFPLRSLLVIGDVYAQQPLHDDEPVEWNAGVGFRYQLSPYLALDAGAGRRLTGAPAWYVTIGSALAFGLRPFVRVPSP